MAGPPEGRMPELEPEENGARRPLHRRTRRIARNQSRILAPCREGRHDHRWRRGRFHATERVAHAARFGRTRPADIQGTVRPGNAGAVVATLPGVRRVDEGFQHVQRDPPNAVVQEEFPAAGGAPHRRHQPEKKAAVRFERRPRAARAVPGCGFRRGSTSCNPNAFAENEPTGAVCSSLSQRLDTAKVLMRATPLDRHTHRTEHGVPTGGEDFGHLLSRQAPGPPGEEPGSAAGQPMLARRPRDGLDLHPAVRAHHPTHRVEHEHCDAP